MLILHPGIQHIGIAIAVVEINMFLTLAQRWLLQIEYRTYRIAVEPFFGKNSVETKHILVWSVHSRKGLPVCRV